MYWIKERRDWFFIFYFIFLGWGVFCAHKCTLEGKLTLLYMCAAPCSENGRARHRMKDKIFGDCSRSPQVALIVLVLLWHKLIIWDKLDLMSLVCNQSSIWMNVNLHCRICFLISNCTRSFPITSKVSKSKVLWLITVLRELTKFIGSIEYLRLLQAGYIQMLWNSFLILSNWAPHPQTPLLPG